MRRILSLSLCTLVAVGLAACSSSKSSSSPAAASDSASAGGGDVAPLIPARTSGTRLRAKYVSAPDGVRQFVGWYDAQRKEDCSFQQSGQRSLCIPQAPQSYRSGLFADPQCARGLSSIAGSGNGGQVTCGASAYVSEYAGGGGPCGTPSVAQIYKATKLDPSAPIYSRGPNGCQVLTNRPSTGLVELGDVVPSSEFVEATETIEASGRLIVTYLSASDGAKEHTGYRLANLDVECTFQLMADKQTRCVPKVGYGFPLYADESCSTPSIIESYGYPGPCGQSSPPTTWVLRDPSDRTCGTIASVFAIGKPYNGFGPMYQRIDNGSTLPPTCTLRSTGSFSGGYTLGANLTASLPSTPRVGSGSGRLVPALVASGAGQDLVPGWHDTERDADCSFATASDGKLRCLPVAATASLFFADDTCQSQTKVALLGAPICAGGSAYGLDVSATCPAITRVYSIGTNSRDLPSGSALTAPGHCVRTSGLKKAYDATEVDPALFVEGTLTTE